MEKYLLLKELTDSEGKNLCIDIMKILIEIIHISDFQYGRAYQLVIDRSKNIKAGPGRRYECYSYILSKTGNDLIHEAYT